MSTRTVTRFGGVSGWAYAVRHWRVTLFVALVFGLPVALFRLLSGRNMRGGGRSTDATFLRPASRVRGAGWANLRGVTRAAVRLGVLAGVVLWFVASAVVVVAALALAGLVARAWWQHHQDVQHERHVLRPVWPAVAGIIGVDVDEHPARWLDIPGQMLDVATDPPEHADAIAVGLRAADADDDKRVAELVRLFDQRFGVRHVGSIDYAQREVLIKRRPPEPPVWPAVASVLGVHATELAEQWLQVPDDPQQPGAQAFVRLPDDVTRTGDIATELLEVMSARFGGTWEAAPRWDKPYRPADEEADRHPVHRWDPSRALVVLTKQRPAPKPPEHVDFGDLFPEGIAVEGVMNC